MHECAVCHMHSNDDLTVCPRCGTNLVTDSVRARALKQIQESPRASAVFVVAPAHACPTCRSSQGTYPKDSAQIPALPHEGCSCADGCVCRYEPLVVEVGP
jgi:RNA polymerase subunit RPABC4/transcription elongation factor Spt4